jgi:hypothetical protein
MSINRILYDYIVKRYESVVDFSAASGISLIDLCAVLLKDNVSEEIGIGLELCVILDADAREIALKNKVREKEIEREKAKAKAKELKNRGTISVNAGIPVRTGESNRIKDEIYMKCVRLSEREKTKVLEYIEKL